jgi:hypothetical protein
MFEVLSGKFEVFRAFKSGTLLVPGISEVPGIPEN